MPLADNSTLSTLDDSTGRRIWLYPIRVMGRWLRIRTVVAWVLIALLLVAPWIDVGGHPAMLFDIARRRFYFWGLRLMATDGSYLLFAAGLAVFSVFLFTALFGRVWCGWGCPQTVFMESLIRPIEQWIEGKPSARKRLDAAPWRAGKIARKAIKHALFLLVAGAISTTFTAYFLGRDGVVQAQLDPLGSPVGTSVFILLTGLLYFDFSWFREQTCLVVCPYGRFQAVLMDGDSLCVSYDHRRGEPRGKPGRRDRRQGPRSGIGDCVDCGRCQAVCPTGIDIRDGVQMECINCMACIDACDEIMDKVGRPQGLVRFSSERALEGEARRLLRPRVLLYGAALLGVMIAFGASVGTRAPLQVHLTRQKGSPFQRMPDGAIRNSSQLRLTNRSDEVRRITLTLAAPADARMITPLPTLEVRPDEVRHVPVFFVRPQGDADGGVMVLQVRDQLGFEARLTFPFLVPEIQR